MAVAAMFSRPGKADEDSTTLVEAVRDGWWYSAQLPNERRIVAFLTDGDLPSARAARNRTVWFDYLDNTSLVKNSVHEPVYAPLGEPAVFPADSSRLGQAAGNRWVAAGDAMASFDPLSSQGILTALTGGLQVGNAVLELRGGKNEAIRDYARVAIELYQRFLTRRLRAWRVSKR